MHLICALCFSGNGYYNGRGINAWGLIEINEVR